MTDPQSNQLDMYNVVGDLYIAHKPVIDTVPARVAAFSIFQGNRAAINSNLAIQSVVTAGVTADKNQVRTSLDTLSSVIFGIARAWAIANEDNTNAEEFNFSLSAIARIKDDTIVPFLTHRLTIVTDNATALLDYGITATIITTWTDLMTAYTAINATPRTVIVSRSVSTAQLGILFEANQKLLRDTIDPLMLIFKVSDPDLYEHYVRSRIVIDRHGAGNPDPDPTDIKISGIVSDAFTLSPIVGATIELSNPEGALTATSGVGGFYTLTVQGILEPTSANLSASAPGYATNMRPITISPGENITENFALSPTPPAP